MRLCYILPSPTFGMHQYTADLANRMAAAGHEVSLVTTTRLPSGRYAPDVEIVTPVNNISTGFSREGVNIWRSRRIVDSVVEISPDLIHFTGPHLWNINLVRSLKRRGYPVIHTIHDLVPHSGMRMGSLLGYWNRMIIGQADHILVHGQLYLDMLLQNGFPAHKVTYTPLLHLFVGYEEEQKLIADSMANPQGNIEPYALFFGRLEKYKGVGDLLAAFQDLVETENPAAKLILAGPGPISSFWSRHLPDNVVLINKLIEDEEAVDLFKQCSLVVLPYTAATQSALVAAAYFFNKPVIVSDSGALAEHVSDGQTGFVVRAGDRADLRQILGDAFNSQERLQEMGHSGRIWYEESRNSEFKALSNLYRSCLGEDSG